MTWYEGPVIDAHHHFWQPRLGFQPWLTPEANIPFRYGDYSSIKADYLPKDLRADAAEAGIHLVGTVSMETEWELGDPVGEMRYTSELANREGLPTAAVAHAVLRDVHVERTIAELSQFPFVKGIRNKPVLADRAGCGQSSSATLLSDHQWQQGFSVLGRYGLSFDLQTPWMHLPEARTLLERYPETEVIVNHAGLPADRSPGAMRDWADALRKVAAYPQVSVKCSGIGVPGHAWTAELNRPVIESLVEIFGPDRVMCASNFPVDSLVGSYSQIWNGFREVLRQYDTSEQTMIFGGTASRVYRLSPTLMDVSPSAQSSR